MKTEILQKSLQQFLKHGIREMNNEKLVELLGISTKTIYKYFKNKEHLLEEALYLYHGQQEKILKNLPAKDAVCLFFDLWRTAILAEYDVNNKFFKDLHYYYPELEKKIQAAITKKFTQQFLRIIYLAIEQGSVRKDIKPEVVLESIYVQYEAAARSERFKRFRLTPDSLMLNTLATTIRGICTVKGAEVLDEHIQRQPLFVKEKKSNKKAPEEVARLRNVCIHEKN